MFYPYVVLEVCPNRNQLTQSNTLPLSINLCLSAGRNNGHYYKANINEAYFQNNFHFVYISIFAKFQLNTTDK